MSFGLTRGNKQRGLRRASTAQDPAKLQTIRRRWRVTGVPRDWACDDLCQFLKDWGFEDVSVDERMPRRKQTAWAFSAIADREIDYRVVDLTTGSLEATRIDRGRQTSHAKALPLEWKQHFKETTGKPKGNGNAATAPAAEEMVIDGGNDHERLANESQAVWPSYGG